MTATYILDIDGTLMPSHEVDNQCYWQAVHEVFELPGGTLDLHDFNNVTDNGIFLEWCEKTLGRPAQGAEVIAVREQFLRRLEQAAESNPGAFAPLPGVVDWLAARSAGSVAIATGGWEHSARFKLRQSGLDRFNLPLASSDQGENRTAIMRHALDRLMNDRNDSPEPITYVGDGLWDVAAATTLGWRFIGIATGRRAASLQQAGAAHVQANFHGLE